MKPNAPVEYRGEFKPIATSAPGVRLCEHLPLLAKQAHHLAVINSVAARSTRTIITPATTTTSPAMCPIRSFLTLGNNRTPFPDDWPFMGTVVGSRRPPHGHLAERDHAAAQAEQAARTPGPASSRPGSASSTIRSIVHGNLERPLEFRAPALTLEGGVVAGPARRSRLDARRPRRRPPRVRFAARRGTWGRTARASR